MKLTKKSSYALNIIGEMLDNPNTVVSSKQIAEKYDLKVSFVFLVLGELRKADLISPKKGPGGGYTLNVKPESITPHMVLSAVAEQLNQRQLLNESDNSMCKSFVAKLENNIIAFLKTPILSFKEVS